MHVTNGAPGERVEEWAHWIEAHALSTMVIHNTAKKINAINCHVCLMHMMDGNLGRGNAWKNGRTGARLVHSVPW